MNVDDACFKVLLLARRAELESIAATGDAAAQAVELARIRVGRLSRIDALQGRAMAQATVARGRLELIRIGATLERIERGEFGACAFRGEPITPPRLEFDPAAVASVSCAQARAPGR